MKYELVELLRINLALVWLWVQALENPSWLGCH